MYLVNVDVRESDIDGKGVFTIDNIPAGAIVWKYDHSHDKSLSKVEFDSLPEDKKTSLLRIAYLSPSTDRWIYPPSNDPACYTNHSDNNNLSVNFDRNVSEEPYFIANRDIKSGEELTNNYTEFDKNPMSFKT